MHHYKIIVAYDGTDYAGWQLQPDKITVAQQLQDTFFEVFGQSIVLHGISRTDAGVHAQGQVAVFKTDLSSTPQALLRAWNARLPGSISIHSIELVNDRYNPHAYVHYKTYWYHFFLERPQPFMQRYGFYAPYKTVDIDKLGQCLQVFVGTHDFRSFCTGDEHEDTVRTICHASVVYVPENNMYRIVIQGPKFLRYMVRRIVGACLYVASKEHLSSHVLARALGEKNPQQKFPKAPAQGLMLHEVVYNKEMF